MSKPAPSWSVWLGTSPRGPRPGPATGATGAPQRRPDVLGPQGRVVIEQLPVGHPDPQLLEDVSHGQPGPLEHRLAHHHVLPLLDVVLPADRHWRTLLPRPIRADTAGTGRAFAR